jgi:hypothetical protein
MGLDTCSCSKKSSLMKTSLKLSMADPFPNKIVRMVIVDNHLVTKLNYRQNSRQFWKRNHPCPNLSHL